MPHTHRLLYSGISMVLAAICTIGCEGQTPLAPSQPSGSSSGNNLPRITNVRVLSQRVEAGETVDFAADVEDDETPVQELQLLWKSAIGGSFAPIAENSRNVRWTAPFGANPGSYAVNLTVSEMYRDGQVVREHQTSADAPVVHYNDSIAEIRRISMRFLTELFPTYSVGPSQAVQDFSDSCQGKRDEHHDVELNRANFQILFGSYTNVTVELNAAKTSGTVRGICLFRDIPKSGPLAGRMERVEGICRLTVVYENWNWYLCDSGFTLLGNGIPETLRYRAPGLR